VGKGRLMDRLVAEFPDKFGRTVSHTTRRPKEHERQGAPLQPPAGWGSLL
jgi:guanylate kinase